MSTMSSLGEVEFPRLTAATAVGVLEAGASPWPAHILVCTDDSASSGDALAMADALAMRANTSLDVLPVFTPSIREVGNPVQAIVERSKCLNADLVIVGQGSRDPLVRKGGVVIPASLSRYTDVPMLAATAMVRALPRDAVVLVDREPVDLGVIRAALGCIEDVSFVWVLIHAGTTTHSGDGVQRKKGTLADIMSVIRREAAKVSKRIVVRAVYRTGDPVDLVLTLAREVGADLIVTPVHGTPGPVRSLLPNIADRLLLAAPCSVLVVPES